jgi:hypothetical protein
MIPTSLLRIVTVLFILLVPVISAAQKTDYRVLLKSVTIDPQENLESYIASPAPVDIFNGRYYRMVQFYSIPAETQRKAIEQTGLKLLHYLPRNTYFVSFPEGYDPSQLKNKNIRSILPVDAAYKLTPALASGNYPSWAIPAEGQLDLIVNYFSDIPALAARFALAEQKITILGSYDFSYKITVRIKASDLQKLASLPFISYIEPIDPPSEPEDITGRSSHRSNVIASDFASGRHYDGTGVNIAVGDDGIIGPHIDYQGRTDQTNVSGNSGNHGDHVSGIIMGAGNLDPKGKGMAYGADLFVFDVWDAVNNTPTTYLSPGIRITSTSYSDGCNAGYTSFAQTVDQQIRQMPSLMHVFSAGNSGTSDCSYGAGAGWGNVTGGVKIGKNVIAVGNLDYLDGLANSSSRGPAHDGRIKPDVCAVGTSVYSTIDVNSYVNMSGTSMACPGTSGTLAQLYHAYKDMNSGNDPESGLMKAIMMNTADDLGNPGPDFKFGYGRINAYRAVRAIEDGRYIVGSVGQGITNTHTISVPGGEQLRVMLYWTDYEAATNASVALVNDLNMQVLDPFAGIYDPWVLDITPNPTALDAPATRGIDNLNNTEQVTIESISPGTYTINVNGFAVPQGPQTYYLVYEFTDDAVTVTYPNGGEGFVPGETETIRWDAYGSAGTFTIEYSTDNGVTWVPISSTVPATTRSFNWVVPSAVTGRALIKVTRGSSIDDSDAAFSIIGVPQNIAIDWACPDSIKLSWDSVAGATGYEISMLGSRYMDSIGVSTNTSFIVHNVMALNDYWFSVKALGPTSAIGRRAIAINKAPGTFNCPLAFDAALNNVTSPEAGTWYDCHNYSSVPVTIAIENMGLSALSNVPVNYSINGGPPVTETFAGPLAPGNSTTYTFTVTANLSTVAMYSIATWVSYSGDGNIYNDSTQVTVQVVSGSASSLPWIENFESFTPCATGSDCEATICPFINGSTNEMNGAGDDVDWRTNDGDTPSQSTGPSVDHTTGTATGKYVYTETSNGCDLKTAEYISPCIDLTGVNLPQLDFWYHMYGADMGALHVDINTNGTWTNDIMPALSGNYGNSWLQQSVNLSSYSGQMVNLRFRAVSATGYAGDMAIDDISVSDATSVNEVSFNNNFLLYPNPGQGVFNLSVTGSATDQLELVVTDMQGREISRQGANGNKGAVTVLDLSTYSAGVYFLHITSGKQQFHTKLTKL